jgi:hypothetical protein
MFVAVSLGSTDGVKRKKEDIHPAVGMVRPRVGQFFGRDR